MCEIALSFFITERGLSLLWNTVDNAIKLSDEGYFHLKWKLFLDVGFDWHLITWCQLNNNKKLILMKVMYIKRGHKFQTFHECQTQSPKILHLHFYVWNSTLIFITKRGLFLLWNTVDSAIKLWDEGCFHSKVKIVSWCWLR